jgi:hypothetical protein
MSAADESGSGPIGRSSPLPWRGRLADSSLLERVAFSDHAIERFAQRAGLRFRSRSVVEPIARALLATEGWLVPHRPPWARSRRRGEVYLQAGDWMLFIAAQDPMGDVGYFLVMTAINRPIDVTWRDACRRGHIKTRPIPGLLIDERGPAIARDPRASPAPPD